ncbi:unnamed protein product [Urochloa decumbens]|uniref:Replication protein A 70 kDa DNA-binding subunit B/D first OB fold domain-containing protein n=1 Tax=Urochloa decumbens TaxID=240449 RepID=A0ABC8ZCX1_9POAL
MGSSQGGFTPLSRLTFGTHGRRMRVRVRVSRIWVASNPNSGEEYGLDSLLIDDEGATMQARAYPRDMKRLKNLLIEGKVYALLNFTVRRKMYSYMACRNDLMIYMGGQTVVDEISDDICSSIPLHSFEFVDFGDVPFRDKDNSLFTDVIGQIVSIEEVGQAWKWDTWRNISFRNLHTAGRQLNIALYEDLGRNFDAEQVIKQGQQVSIVAVFTGMIVQLYKGIGFTVRSTTASKYYLDLDILEVQELRASLADQHKPIDRLPCQLQNPVNLTELVKSRRTIEQLKSLNPDELHWGTIFLCTVTLKGINCTKDWWYKGCFHCEWPISWDGSKPFCIKGCPNNALPVLLYKLDAVMEDTTGAMNIMIFGKQAEVLVGLSADKLVGEITGEQISAVISSHQSRALVVGPHRGGFVVAGVPNDDDAC